MSSPSRVRVSGPLVGHAAGFRADLEAQGYRRNVVANQLQLFAHVSRWLENKGLGPQHLTRERVLEFLSARRSAGYTLWLSEKGVAPLLTYLRSVGVAPAPEAPVAVASADRVLEEFRSYLVHERGLAPGTVAADVHVARLFLATRVHPDLGLEALTPADVVAFVTAQCGRFGRLRHHGVACVPAVLPPQWSPPSNCGWSASPHTPSARRWPTAGATATCSSWETPPTSPRPSWARAWQPGLRDALNLTWKLAGVLDGRLPESVLNTYEQERKAHAAAMILMAVSMGAAMTGGGGWATSSATSCSRACTTCAYRARAPAPPTAWPPGCTDRHSWSNPGSPGSWPEHCAPTQFWATACVSMRSSGTASR